MAAGDDEPMTDAPPPKARRRFAPQLVEESVKSSSSSSSHARSNGSSPDDYSNIPTLPHEQLIGMAPPTSKPKRRFAPQLVEESVKSSSSSNSSSSRRQQDSDLFEPTTRRTTKDASVQVSDMEMADAPPQTSSASSSMSSKIRRFAPVPIETTYDSYRVNNSNIGRRNPYGPTAELTPDHSPTDQPPQPAFVMGGKLHKLQNSKRPEAEKKPKRKFAPQLIETTRRARKAGQDGPATKPTDKTDITPGTNHIYAPKTKRKPGGVGGIGHRAADDSGVARSSPRSKPVAGAAEVGGAATPSSWALNALPGARRGTRSSSFHPDLDTIASSESEKDEGGEAIGAQGESIPAVDITGPEEDDNGTTWNSRKPSLRERRESCDEEFSGYLLAVAAREAERQRELDQVMSAFPNGLQPAPVEHFFVRGDSEDESYMEVDEPLRHGPSQLLRRKSTDPVWAVKEMRAHHEKLSKQQGDEVEDSKGLVEDKDENDAMDVDAGYQLHFGTREPEMAPPLRENSLWRSESAARRGSQARRGSTSPYLMRDPERRSSTSPYLIASSPVVRGRANSRSPVNDPASVLGPPAATPPFRANNPFGLPRGLRVDGDEDEQRKMRKAATPPMQGSDLRFRRCPSPKRTRMEPDHPYQVVAIPRVYEDAQRDETEATGLWRGYCSARSNETVVTALQALPLLSTPEEPANPHADPFAASFDAHMSPARKQSSSGGGSSMTTSNVPTKRSSLYGKGAGVQDPIPATDEALEEQLRREKARQDHEKFLSTEFDAGFVTQVYNYISLGYPATARAFDEELSKISGINVATLRGDDTRNVIKKGFMLEMEMKSLSQATSTGSSESSEGKGVGSDSIMRSPEEDEAQGRPPRWQALRLYILEWGRQHPNLGDDENPLAWGVKARRGSWAI